MGSLNDTPALVTHEYQTKDDEQTLGRIYFLYSVVVQLCGWHVRQAGAHERQPDRKWMVDLGGVRHEGRLGAEGELQQDPRGHQQSLWRIQGIYRRIHRRFEQTNCSRVRKE